MRSPLLPAAVVIVLATMTTAACTASVTPPPTHAVPQNQQGTPFDGITPPLSDPLAAYGQDPAVLVALFKAEDILTDSCMKKFGFSGYQPHDYDAFEASFRTDDSRLYGITDPKVAALYGYMPAPSSSAQTSTDDATPSYLFVLNGLKAGQKPTEISATASPGKVAGLAVPPAGCLGEARKKLTGDVNEQPPQEAILGHMLDDQAWLDAWQDSTTAAAKKEWSECMASAGFTMHDPLDDIPERNGTEVSSAEVRQALADIACKKSTDFVTKANAENVRVAQQYLEQNQLALQASKAYNDQALKRANAVISAQP